MLSCCELGFYDTLGASGGVLLMWDTRVVVSLEEWIGYYYVICSFKNVEDGWEWTFAGVYNPNSNSDRRLLWEELAGCHSLQDIPWFLSGDFNITHFPSERFGISCSSPSMKNFPNFIFDLDLLDLPPIGGVSTWSNSRGWLRLECFLVSPS